MACPAVLRSSVAALLALLLAGCAIAAAPAAGTPAEGQFPSASAAADLVQLNGRIVTGDEARPEVEALAIVGQCIAAVGSSEDMRRHVGPNTRVVDLEGRLAIPGFIDAPRALARQPDNPVLLTHASGHASFARFDCVEVDSRHRLRPGMFVAQVIGKLMEARDS